MNKTLHYFISLNPLTYLVLNVNVGRRVTTGHPLLGHSDPQWCQIVMLYLPSSLIFLLKDTKATTVNCTLLPGATEDNETEKPFSN